MDEYLAKLGLDVGDLLSAIDSVLTRFGQLEASGIQVPKSLAKLERTLAQTAGGFRGLDKAQAASETQSKTLAQELNSESKAWTNLAEKVAETQAAYRAAARDRVTGESTPGAKTLPETGLADLQQAQRVRDAQNASALSAANLSQTAGRGYANPSTFQDGLIAAQGKQGADFASQLKADLTERQRLEEETTQAVNAQIAARGRDKERELAEMLAVDRQIEAETKRDASARSTEVGGRSYGNASVLNDAEISRNSEATKSASDQLKQYLLAQNAARVSEEQRAKVSLPRLRYAMYDLSTFSTILGGALVAGGVAAVKTSVDYEALYAEVQRTSDILSDRNSTAYQKSNQYTELRTDLVDLSTQIPVTFSDITKIATAGNQLGVPSQNIEGFTEAVAKFSKITNLSADDAATAFGRLGQLLHDTDYKGLGDDIAYLGVTSVATESEIVKVAQQLAVTTEQAGFSTKATLALSSSLASLGVKPEQSRGTFIRVFGAITAAVKQPGKELNDLAAISGLSAKQFQQQWGTDANGTFQKFIAGVGRSSGSAKANLAQLGITAVRDVQTIGLLAQNQDVLSKANKDVDNAGGFANAAYQKQAETTAARIEVLKNSFLALFDSIGTGVDGPVKTLVDGLTLAVNVARALVSNPIGAWAVASAVGLTAIVGALLLIAGGALRVSANLVAYRQIQEDLGIETVGLRGIFITLAAALEQARGGTQRLAAANAELAASEGLVAEGATAETIAQAGNAADTAAPKAAKLTRALGALGLVGAVVGFIALVPALLDGTREFVNGITGAVPTVDKLTDSLRNLEDQAGKSQALTDLQKALPDADFLKGRVGIDYSKGGATVTGAQALVSRVRTGKDPANTTIDPGADSVLNPNSISNQVTKLQDYDQALSKLSGTDAPAARAGLALLAKQFQAAGLGSLDLNKLLPETARALNLTASGSIDAALKQKALAKALQDSGAASQSYIDDLFGQSIAAQKVTGDLGDLGTSIAKDGADIALSGQTIASTLQDIYTSSDGASDAASKVLGFANSIEAAGLASTTQLASVRAYAKELDPTATATAFSIDGLVDSFAKQKASAKDAAAATDENTKSVRTLSDYVNDLQGVLTRAFNLRFGNQQALDTITSSYRKLRDDASDAAGKVKDLKAELAELKGDQAVSKYQLGVANQFGDVERAAKIRADLQKQNQDIADKQKDLASARADQSRALTGNSAGAIQNRASLTGIIQQGQGYLTSLAENGATQSQLTSKAGALKKQFIDQATQLGFSRKEVLRLAGAFDDMKTVIGQVPKNVDVHVRANTNPATNAIREFVAKAAKTTAKVKVEADDGGLDALSASIAAGIKARLTNTAGVQGLLPSQVGTPVSNAPDYFKVKGKRDGGYTGNGPTWAPAGVYHGQEYVLNSQGAQMFPRQMLDAANRGVAPQITRVTANASIASGTTMSLGREERQLLRAAGRGSQNISVSADRFGAAMDDAFKRSNRRGE